MSSLHFLILFLHFMNLSLKLNYLKIKLCFSDRKSEKMSVCDLVLFDWEVIDFSYSFIPCLPFIIFYFVWSSSYALFIFYDSCDLYFLSIKHSCYNGMLVDYFSEGSSFWKLNMSRRFEHHSLFKSFVFIWHGGFSFGNVGRVFEIEKSLVNITWESFSWLEHFWPMVKELLKTQVDFGLFYLVAWK